MMPSIFAEDLFDNMFDMDAMFGRKNPLYGKHAKNLMKTDIRVTDKTYELDIDLPGFKKDEIQVELENGYLTIRAEKGLDKDEQDQKGRYIRQERFAGACTRSFYVGDLQPEDVKAQYESGVLSLTIQKGAPRQLLSKTRIAIE